MLLTKVIADVSRTGRAGADPRREETQLVAFFSREERDRRKADRHRRAQDSWEAARLAQTPIQYPPGQIVFPRTIDGRPPPDPPDDFFYDGDGNPLPGPGEAVLGRWMFLRGPNYARSTKLLALSGTGDNLDFGIVAEGTIAVLVTDKALRCTQWEGDFKDWNGLARRLRCFHFVWPLAAMSWIAVNKPNLGFGTSAVSADLAVIGRVDTMLLSKSIVPASPSWEYDPFKSDWLDRAFAHTMISAVVAAITSNAGANRWLADATAVDIDAFVGSATEHRVWFEEPYDISPFGRPNA